MFHFLGYINRIIYRKDGRIVPARLGGCKVADVQANKNGMWLVKLAIFEDTLAK